MAPLLTVQSRLYVKNQRKFNRYMTDRIHYWSKTIEESGSSGTVDPVSMSLSDAIGENLLFVHVSDYKRESRHCLSSVDLGYRAFCEMYQEVL